jgi:multiple sugar transport system substrate-binding protein
MKSNIKKQLIYILVGLISFGGTALSCSGGPSTNSQPVTLKFWKPFDSTEDWSSIISAYTATRKNVRIEYTQKPVATYQEDLVDAMAAGDGPDIYSIHQDWLPRYQDKIQTATISKLYPQTNLRDVFADTVTTDLTDGDTLYALPSSIDTLAMYYNRQNLASAGIARPPSTWPELVAMIPKLTRVSGSATIAQSTIALGTSNNVNRGVDILQLLMLQQGVKFYDDSFGRATLGDSDAASTSAASQALKFYTQFSNPASTAYTWNGKQIDSVDTFAQGKVTFLLGYSYLRPTLAAKQAFLDYGTAPVPQLSDTASKVNFANYWAETVWKGSKNPGLAWDFIKFATSYEQNKAYVAATGLPSSRKDVLTEQQKDANLAVFATNVFSARSVVKPEASQFEKIFTDLIDSVAINNTPTTDAIAQAKNKLDLLLKRYPINPANGGTL